MDDFVGNFYDNTVFEHQKQRGVLGFFYYRLKRFEKHRATRIVELISKDRKYNRVLDIGCADGGLLNMITKKISPKEVFGIDVSSKEISRAHKAFPKNRSNFTVQNIDQGLKFETKYFDLITMAAVLEHVFDPITVIKEISRITNKGGIFIIEVPNIAFITHRFGLLFGKRPRTSWDDGWDGGHLQYFTKTDLVKLLKENGFDIIAISGSGIFYRIRSIWGRLLLGDIIIKAKRC